MLQSRKNASVEFETRFCSSLLVITIASVRIQASQLYDCHRVVEDTNISSDGLTPIGAVDHKSVSETVDFASCLAESEWTF